LISVVERLQHFGGRGHYVELSQLNSKKTFKLWESVTRLELAGEGKISENVCRRQCCRSALVSMRIRRSLQPSKEKI